MEAIGKAGYTAGRQRVHRDGRRGQRGLGRREEDVRVQEVRARPTRTSEQMVDLWDEWTKNYPICSLEDGLAEERLGRLGVADEAARATGCSWWATTSSSPTRRSSRKASARASANSILIKLNQIGTVTETLDTVKMAADSRLHRGDLAPLGRDRGLDDCRPRGGHRGRPDQDRLGEPLGSHREVQPVAPHRAVRSAAPRATAARARSSR